MCNCCLLRVAFPRGITNAIMKSEKCSMQIYLLCFGPVPQMRVHTIYDLELQEDVLAMPALFVRRNLARQLGIVNQTDRCLGFSEPRYE